MVGRQRGLASLVVGALALVLVAAGCGKSADEKADEAYANSVCNAIAGWQTQVKSIATDLTGGISAATLQSKVTKVETATKSLVTQVKALPPPATAQGAATKQQLDQFETQLKTTVDSTKTAVAAVQANGSASTVVAALVAVVPQVKSLVGMAKSTLTALQNSKEAMSSAFKSADSCKSLTSSK